VRLSDDDIRAAYYCCAEVLRGRRLCGQPVPAWLRRLYDRLDAEVRASRSRQENACQLPELEPDEWISAQQAATILSWSKRHVQRRATDLDGRIIGGRWLFRREDVIDYAEGRHE
jgi:hypothetical protein